MTTDASLEEIADAAAALGELRTAAHEILARAWSPERSRALLGRDEPAFDEDLWSTVRSLGWCDVLVPEAAKGGGATLAELCVLAEEAGAAAAPVPLVSTAAAAWLEGRCVEGTPLLLAGDGRIDNGAVSGLWRAVPFGAVATRLLLHAGTGDDAVVVAVDARGPGVQLEPVRALDHGPAATVELTDAPAEILARGSDADDRLARATRIAQLATVAELIGVAAAANAAACEYAKVRVTFGRPIGTYQAIKHRLVDQRAAIEVARALVARAAHAHDRDHPDAEALTSLASFWAVDTLRTVPEGALQVFGGIGYTWEHDAHVHLRRAACLTAALGRRAAHRDVVAAWLGRRHTT